MPASLSVLTPEILRESRSHPEGFGFNGLGAAVFHRTYVRRRPDGSLDEPFADGNRGDLTAVLARVVEGTYRIQREHQPASRWDEGKARRSAAEMFHHMRRMYFLPPGRGLWAMGSDFVNERGVFEALQNCAFMSTEFLPTEGGDAWRWMAEMLMLGVGVGFDTKGAGRLTLRRPRTDVVRVFVVPDTREGWGDAFEALWDSYQQGGATVRFDYSLVRPKGTYINGFGGVASGPEPLAEALELGRRVLDRAAERPLTSRVIVDFGNLIGQCVVAGNVRRSAEIALGHPHDREFLDLKNPAAFGGWEGLAKERPWSWLSNNSLLVGSHKDEPDYTDVAARIYENGEPGVVWIGSARRYGRFGEERPDWDAIGVNPCAEQQLGHREMCTLVETFPSRIPDLATYVRALKYAYLYAKTVTIANAMVSDDISRAVMTRNYRIGLSTSGIVQAIAQRGEAEMVRWWRTGYEVVQRYDEEYSRWLGVPRSVRTTSVKPSGTVSLVAGVTPGVHFPVSEYYLRRFDVPANSELLPLLVANGYEVEPSLVNPGTSFKVLFPVHAGRGVRSVGDVPLREQVRLAALAQAHHADNMVSFTGTFSRETTSVADVADALRQARGSLKAVSFLPAEHGYEQAPYEPIDAERYARMAARLRPVDFDLIAHEDELYCGTDVCEIRDEAAA